MGQESMTVLHKTLHTKVEECSEKDENPWEWLLFKNKSLYSQLISVVLRFGALIPKSCDHQFYHALQCRAWLDTVRQMSYNMPNGRKICPGGGRSQRSCRTKKGPYIMAVFDLGGVVKWNTWKMAWNKAREPQIHHRKELDQDNSLNELEDSALATFPSLQQNTRDNAVKKHEGFISVHSFRDSGPWPGRCISFIALEGLSEGNIKEWMVDQGTHLQTRKQRRMKREPRFQYTGLWEMFIQILSGRFFHPSPG